MTARISNFANAFETQLTGEMGPTDTTANVLSTTGLTSPCYLVIEPDSSTQREVIYFNGSFAATTLATSSVTNRYLPGSAAASGLTHPTGAKVRFSPLKQHFDDLHDRVNTRGIDVSAYGALGDGTTNDYTAIQAAIDALPDSGGTLVFPAGSYRVDSSPTISDKADIVVRFEGGAWIEPRGTAWGLVIDDCTRVTIDDPRVRFETGTPSGGIHVFSSTWVTIHSPRIWCNMNVPAGLTGILFDDNSYWGTVHDPLVRLDNGGLTGTFTHGIRFYKESNAGRVLSGSINDCASGVTVDGSNVIVVDGVTFETSTYGVKAVSPTSTGTNDGLIVTKCRYEGSVVLVRLDAGSYTALTAIFSVYGNKGSYANELSNPSSYETTLNVHGGVLATGNDKKFALRQGECGIADSGGALSAYSNSNVLIDSDNDSSGAGSVYLRTQGNNLIIAGPGTGGGVNSIMIGTGGTMKVGFFGVTPVSRPAAWTQTYSTASKTVANLAASNPAALTAATLTDNTSGTANTTLQALPDPTDTPASADALRDDLVANLLPALRNNYADLAAQVNALVSDLTATRAQVVNLVTDATNNKQNVNAIIDDNQTLGLAQ